MSEHVVDILIASVSETLCPEQVHNCQVARSGCEDLKKNIILNGKRKYEY